MLRKTPLKSKTPLRSNTPLRSYSTLKTKTPLRAKSPLRAVSPKAEKPKVEQTKPKKRRVTTNYVADMDRVFQYYIRLRDVMPGGYGKCISCGKIKTFNHLQAGHFFSRKHMSTRWNEQNVNAECEYCNCWNGEHLLTYKENLIRKIGMQGYQVLDYMHNQPRKWSDFEIKAMIRHYGQEIIRLASAKKLPVTVDVQRIIRKYQKMPL